MKKEIKGEVNEMESYNEKSEYMPDEDPAVYTLIIMGNYRRVKILLNKRRVKNSLPKDRYNYYNKIIRNKLERGLD